MIITIQKHIPISINDGTVEQTSTLVNKLAIIPDECRRLNNFMLQMLQLCDK
jgi:hypothetical protein